MLEVLVNNFSFVVSYVIMPNIPPAIASFPEYAPPYMSMSTFLWAMYINPPASVLTVGLPA
jgi:hypothetical protein